MALFRWPLLVFAICLPVAWLAAGYDVPFLAPAATAAKPAPVPAGDVELAWIHTTTSGGPWERFVTGVKRAAKAVPGLTVDDSAAFREQSTAVPEVVIRSAGQSGAVRIRWYKLSSYAKSSEWVDALAKRDPPPLAVIGGGSSDRARDLAVAMNGREEWVGGGRPLLLLTTASAEKVAQNEDDDTGQPLLSLYPKRTFRFCFSNKQMAAAMLDFVLSRRDLAPRPIAEAALPALAGSAAAAAPPPFNPAVFSVVWQDDPYSQDMHEQFSEALPATGWTRQQWRVPFSIGGYYVPNRTEAEVAEQLLAELRKLPPQRVLLNLPTVPAPARRLLRTLAESSPRLSQRIVVLNGDGVTVNTVLRDGGFAWPIHALPVPIVMFTHNDPTAWDDELVAPTSTEDVLHLAELAKLSFAALFTGGLPGSADEFADRLKAGPDPFFHPDGSRRAGRGEHVVLLKPAGAGRAAGQPDARLDVFRRAASGWTLTRSLPIVQSRAGGGG